MRTHHRSIAPLLLLIAGGCGSTPPGDAPAPSVGPDLPAVVAVDRDQPLERIAFGSCSDEDVEQPLWAPILHSDPQLWVWLGDNIYADTEDMELMWAKYEMQLADAGYSALRARIPVIGTWDDHDYGANNAGREYPRRAESQQLLLDFLGVPANSPRRRREGVYSSETYGPEGKRVKVILLDVRYHRDQRGSNGEMLGEEQWRWLEHELRGSDAAVHLIGSGIQVLPVDHPYEKWENFPAERERLLTLIAETGAPGVILLSGDRHIAEIMRIEDARIGYPVYEVTASGMTHSWESADEENRYRLGELMTELNFGMVEIDWDAAPAVLRLQIRDRDDRVRLEEVVALGDIAPGPRDGRGR